MFLFSLDAVFKTCGSLRWDFFCTNKLVRKMHDANHWLGMFYMVQNPCFRKPKISSVANLISLSGPEKRKYLVMDPANNSDIHFSSTIQSL